MAAFVSLQRAECRHVDALSARSVPMASTVEIAFGQRQARRASNMLAQDFWVPHGHDAAMESLRAVLVQRKKGKTPTNDDGASERGATTEDKV